MNDDRIKENIKEIKKRIVELEKMVIDLENIINLPNNIYDETNGIGTFSNVKRDTEIEGKFIGHLKYNKKLSDGSIKDYIGELRKIRRRIFELMNVNIPIEIYEISDVKTVKAIRQLFMDNQILIEENYRSHHSMSAAINNYLTFLEYNSSELVFDE